MARMDVKPLTPLEHLLDRMSSLLTPEMARELVEFRYDAPTQAKIAELAGKANEGTLTLQEREQYAQYVEVGDLIGILIARARKLLREQAA
jgi:hypothetical protein